jgi:hypothetical protein
VTLFYDSAVHVPDIPNGAHAALYYDGLFAVPADSPQLDRLGPVRWITVLGGPHAAQLTGLIDYEQGNEAYAPGQLRAWASERMVTMGKRARVYSNMSNLRRAIGELGTLWQHPLFVWWIAAPPVKLDPEQLQTHIRAVTGLVLPLGKLWGQQFAGGQSATIDTSVLYGEW